uniref:Perilipin n=1 Tax=Cairina moschata TaxID=8855 RepID=A0A8C3CAN6_CAIMO
MLGTGTPGMGTFGAGSPAVGSQGWGTPGTGHGVTGYGVTRVGDTGYGDTGHGVTTYGVARGGGGHLARGHSLWGHRAGGRLPWGRGARGQPRAGCGPPPAPRGAPPQVPPPPPNWLSRGPPLRRLAPALTMNPALGGERGGIATGDRDRDRGSRQPLPPPAAMSAETAAPAEAEREAQSVVSRVASLALVSSARGAVSTAYASTKESHPYVRSVCDVAEKGVKTLTAAAVSGAQPLLTKLEPQISTANEYACKGLDKLEEKLPILQQPTEMVVAGTRELVSSTVSGAVGLARGAVQGSVERTRRALSTGISTVAGSRVGQLLATGADTVLEKSEELVEHYLPRTDEEPAAPVADDTTAASLEQQRRWQSCFVRVGSLSAKLRHRALRRSLGELQRARHSAQHALAQLHRVIELIEQGMDGSLHGARQHLHRMWLEWSRQDGVPMEDSQVEARTLAMLRGLLQQLRAACARLTASARGLPSSVQDTAGHLRHGVEGVHASLARARSFHDLSDMVLAQSRQTVTRAQLSIDEFIEYVGQHAPLPWLVGPFAPALVEYPEDSPVEMAKWNGCVTVGGGGHRAQSCSGRSASRRPPLRPAREGARFQL